ncbi:PAP2 superfamily-domain-containing protein [Haematococcus lacustris]
MGVGGLGRAASLSSMKASCSSCSLPRTWDQLVSQCRSEKYWRWQKLMLDLAFEVVLVVVFLKAYNLVRNQFGSQKCTPQFALGHAQLVIRIERFLGLFWEQEIQGMVINWTSWIRFWNIFYGSAHMAVTVFVLGFLFVLKPAAYQTCRTVFIVMNLLAIIGYAGFPLMPPRLVNVCDDPYGGCVKEYVFEDTLHTVGGLWSWKQKGISKLSNHYAAMPSMHAGYSLWCAVSMYGHSPYMLFKGLAVMYPILTLYCIVVTANHFFLDAVFGALALYAASHIAVYIPAMGRGAGSDSTATVQPLLLPLTEVSLHDCGMGGKQNQSAAANQKHHATIQVDAAAHIQSTRITMSNLQKR